MDAVKSTMPDAVVATQPVVTPIGSTRKRRCNEHDGSMSHRRKIAFGHIESPVDSMERKLTETQLPAVGYAEGSMPCGVVRANPTAVAQGRRVFISALLAGYSELVASETLNPSHGLSKSTPKARAVNETLLFAPSSKVYDSIGIRIGALSLALSLSPSVLDPLFESLAKDASIVRSRWQMPSNANPRSFQALYLIAASLMVSARWSGQCESLDSYDLTNSHSDAEATTVPEQFGMTLVGECTKSPCNVDAIAASYLNLDGVAALVERRYGNFSKPVKCARAIGHCVLYYERMLICGSSRGLYTCLERNPLNLASGVIRDLIFGAGSFDASDPGPVFYDLCRCHLTLLAALNNLVYAHAEDEVSWEKLICHSTFIKTVLALTALALIQSRETLREAPQAIRFYEDAFKRNDLTTLAWYLLNKPLS